MELIVELKKITNLKFLLKNKHLRYLLVGIKNISLTPAATFNLEELELIFKSVENKNIGIILNAERLYNNEELVKAFDVINLIGIEKFSYITYSDFGFAMKFTDEQRKTKLIFRAPTYLTNTADIKLYQEINKYVVISSEISSQELCSIAAATNDVLVDLCGMKQCFYSRRKLLSTYFEYKGIKLDPHKDNYTVIEELRKNPMHIKEDETGTHIFEEGYAYLAEEIKDYPQIKYGIIHTIFMTNDEIKKITEAYSTYLDNFDLLAFIDTCNNSKLYKGAYLSKSILLKGDKNE